MNTLRNIGILPEGYAESIGLPGLSYEELKRAGVLPEQRLARAKRQYEVLKRYGLEKSQLGRALKLRAEKDRNPRKTKNPWYVHHMPYETDSVVFYRERPLGPSKSFKRLSGGKVHGPYSNLWSAVNKARHESIRLPSYVPMDDEMAALSYQEANRLTQSNPEVWIDWTQRGHTLTDPTGRELHRGRALWAKGLSRRQARRETRRAAAYGRRQKGWTGFTVTRRNSGSRSIPALASEAASLSQRHGLTLSEAVSAVANRHDLGAGQFSKLRAYLGAPLGMRRPPKPNPELLIARNPGRSWSRYSPGSYTLPSGRSATKREYEARMRLLAEREDCPECQRYAELAATGRSRFATCPKHRSYWPNPRRRTSNMRIRVKHRRRRARNYPLRKRYRGKYYTRTAFARRYGKKFGTRKKALAAWRKIRRAMHGTQKIVVTRRGSIRSRRAMMVGRKAWQTRKSRKRSEAAKKGWRTRKSGGKAKGRKGAKRRRNFRRSR